MKFRNKIEKRQPRIGDVVKVKSNIFEGTVKIIDIINPIQKGSYSYIGRIVNRQSGSSHYFPPRSVAISCSEIVG